MVAITFRTVGSWGAGVGRNLTAIEFDTNNLNLKDAIEDLQTNPVQPNQIASIDVTDNKMTIELEGGATFGPFTLPIAEFHDRGEWAPTTGYVYGDIFTQDTGLYMSLQDFTSAGAFDPAASNGFGPFYRLLFDAAGMTMTYLDDGFPAVGEPLNKFDVFSVPDVGVFLVLRDHDAAATFDPDATDIDSNPLYKKIFNAIETAIARFQFQYAGVFPSDSSLIWKLIQDDTRVLTLPAGFTDSIGHIEETTTTETIVFSFQYDGDEIGTLTFAPGELLDGDGGQFGAFEGDGAAIANAELFRVLAPSVADATAKFLTLSLVGTYA